MTAGKFKRASGDSLEIDISPVPHKPDAFHVEGEALWNDKGGAPDAGTRDFTSELQHETMHHSASGYKVVLKFQGARA